MSVAGDPKQPLWIRQLHDFTRISLPTLLRYEDRNSMAHGIESRLPFLDYRLAEVGLALPEQFKIRHGYGKWIVRQIVLGRIPDSIRLARYKFGFDVRQTEWLAGGLGAAVRDRLTAREAVIREVLTPGVKTRDAFSDQQFAARPTAFSEAVTLLWLSERV
jgi:asparagine synthase (glutamine-hydrolysing)